METEINMIAELLITPQLIQQELSDKFGIKKRTIARQIAILQDKKI